MSYIYHAESHVLSGRLQRPVELKIEGQAFVSLKGREGHRFQRMGRCSVDGLISFESGYTRVSGNRSQRHGWVTLATAVLEHLNVFDVITADRVVAQVSAELSGEGGDGPSLAFLGTRFENLRISGIPLKLTLNYGICGKKLDGDWSYLDNLDFLNAVKEQTEKIARADGLPKDLKDTYDERLKTIKRLIHNGGSKGSGEPIRCSLVTDIDKSIEKVISGVKVIGHVLLIPDFGTVSLGEITVGERKLSRRPEVEQLLRSDHAQNGHGVHRVWHG